MINYESVILGLILLPDEIGKKATLIEDLKVNHFEVEVNQRIFLACSSLIQQRVNPDTMSIYGMIKDLVENANKYLNQLTQSAAAIPSETLWPDYKRKLKEAKYKRDIQARIRETEINIVNEANAEVVSSEVESLVADLNVMDIDERCEYTDFTDIHQKIMNQIDHGGALEGYSWGIATLDAYTSGIIQGRKYVVGGIKKGGKTRFMVNVLHNLMAQNVPTAVLELEVPEYMFGKLRLSRMLRINEIKMRSRKYLSNDEYRLIKETKLDDKLIALECRAGLNGDQVCARIRRAAKLGYKVFMIDYLQRIPHNIARQAQELEAISNQVADMARNYNIAVIMLSQYNALAEQGEPSMASLKGSGGIGESADAILLLDNLYRREKLDENKDRTNIIIEQRYGESGKIELRTDLGTCYYNDLNTLDNKTISTTTVIEDDLPF